MNKLVNLYINMKIICNAQIVLKRIMKYKVKMEYNLVYKRINQVIVVL